MRRAYLFLIFITVILNMYLIFIWSPYSNKTYNTITTYNDTNNLIDVDNTLNINNEDYREIFKESSLFFSEENLIESLSEDESKELNHILCKLSTSDLGKWIDLKNNLDNKSIIEFFRVIQRRLGFEDYEKVKSIIGRIIDVDRTEALLKNNYV